MQNIYKTEKVYVTPCTKLKNFPYLTGELLKLFFKNQNLPYLRGGFIKRLNVPEMRFKTNAFIVL